MYKVITFTVQDIGNMETSMNEMAKQGYKLIFLENVTGRFIAVFEKEIVNGRGRPPKNPENKLGE